MRHAVAGYKLGRPTSHRLALYRNLVTDLLRYERVQTTLAKARAIQPIAEKICCSRVFSLSNVAGELTRI